MVVCGTTKREEKERESTACFTLDIYTALAS
jgi:hypothetical protein